MTESGDHPARQAERIQLTLIVCLESRPL